MVCLTHIKYNILLCHALLQKSDILTMKFSFVSPFYNKCNRWKNSQMKIYMEINKRGKSIMLLFLTGAVLLLFEAFMKIEIQIIYKWNDWMPICSLLNLVECVVVLWIQWKNGNFITDFSLVVRNTKFSCWIVFH